MAEAISPIEALGYRPSGGRKSSRKTAKGKLLWRMALEQLKKDKKKSVVITLSLAAGLSVFLCLITLIQSQGGIALAVGNHQAAQVQLVVLHLLGGG